GLNEQAKAPFALVEGIFRAAMRRDLSLQHAFCPLALGVFGLQGAGALLERRRAPGEQIVELVVGAAQIFLLRAARAHVLGDRDDARDLALLVGEDRDVAPHPYARAVRPGVTALDDKTLSGVGRIGDRIHILMLEDVLQAHGQELAGRPARERAEAIIDQGEAARRVGLGDADESLADERAQALFPAAQTRLRRASRLHGRADRE